MLALPYIELILNSKRTKAVSSLKSKSLTPKNKHTNNQTNLYVHVRRSGEITDNGRRSPEGCERNNLGLTLRPPASGLTVTYTTRAIELVSLYPYVSSHHPPHTSEDPHPYPPPILLVLVSSHRRCHPPVFSIYLVAVGALAVLIVRATSSCAHRRYPPPPPPP